MEKRLTLAVLFGGRSGEHEVSISSARSVLEVLKGGKYIVHQVGITLQGEWLYGTEALAKFEQGDKSDLEPALFFADPSRKGLHVLRSEKVVKVADIDVVFPMLHGTFGEDGTMQGLLELADLAYIGAGVTGSSVGMDKGIFKDVMRANDIPVVESMIALRSEIETDKNDIILRCEALSPYPLFVKPANLGSSVGITKCMNRSDLAEGLQEAALYDRRVLIERGVEGREIEVSVLGNDHPRASIPGEIQPSREFYSYESKYIDGTSGLMIPAPLPQETSDEIRRLAIKAYLAIDCAGMARVDFFLEKINGKLMINELNTLPGFTAISMYPKLWEASGVSYGELVEHLIDLAVERKTARDRTVHSYRSTT